MWGMDKEPGIWQIKLARQDVEINAISTLTTSREDEMIRDYWTQPPDDQGRLLDEMKQEIAAAEAERVRVVGYITTIEAPDTMMPTTERDRDVIVCIGCFGDLRDRPDDDIWEAITREGDLAYEKCSECEKPLA